MGKAGHGLTQAGVIQRRKAHSRSQNRSENAMKTENDYKIDAVIILAVAALACVCWSIAKPRMITDTNSVRITVQGRAIAVYDRLGEQEYHFRLIHVRRSDAPTEARTAVQTPTIKIELKPGGLIVESDGSVYRITPKAGRCEEWLKRFQMKNS